VFLAVQKRLLAKLLMHQCMDKPIYWRVVISRTGQLVDKMARVRARAEIKARFRVGS